jgi:hypothetical protein
MSKAAIAAVTVEHLLIQDRRDAVPDVFVHVQPAPADRCQHQ